MRTITPPGVKTTVQRLNALWGFNVGCPGHSEYMCVRDNMNQADYMYSSSLHWSLRTNSK